MILVGSQRGGAQNLAAHLFSSENDHVEVYEVRGFTAEDVPGAFREAQATAKGTRCKQFLYSLSFNPPPRERVETPVFEDAFKRAEEKLGLSEQPRVVIFHEKEGRRHAHVVWSRIDAEEMKAVQLSFTHRKLQELSRELYLEHGWRMPKGLTDKSKSDPRNFTLDEWQQAKRQGSDPKAVKTALQDAWASSDSREAFAQALQERGYTLVRGDRRGYLALDVHGEVYSLPKWIGIKTKEVRARLGDADALPSLDEAKAEMETSMRPARSRWEKELERRREEARKAYEERKARLIEEQQRERKALFDRIEERRIRETQERQERFRSGMAGLWDKLRGEHKRLREQNEREAYDAMVRDRKEKDELIFNQNYELKNLDQKRENATNSHVHHEE